MLLAGTKTGKGFAGPWTTMTWVLVLIAAAGSLIFGTVDRMTPPPPVSDSELLKAFPDASAFELKKEPFNHYLALGTSGQAIGAVLITDSVSPSIKGYLGEIGVAVGITANGRITKTAPVRHQETPYYMDMVTASGLYETLGGLDLSRTLPPIDTISGATVSSRAVIADVREAASLAAGSLFNLKVPGPAGTMRGPWSDWKTLALAFVLLLSLLVGSAVESGVINNIVMLLNLVVIGFVLNTPLTLSALSKVLTLDLPGPGNTLLILILFYAIVSVPLHGRSYCRLVCPFGTLQQLLGRLSPWQLYFSPAALAYLPDFRRFVLGLLLILGVWVGWGGFTEVEPFFGLFSFRLSIVLWVMVIFVLAVSVFIRRFWCNTMCPTGTMLSMVSRVLRPGRGRADETV